MVDMSPEAELHLLCLNTWLRLRPGANRVRLVSCQFDDSLNLLVPPELPEQAALVVESVIVSLLSPPAGRRQDCGENKMLHPKGFAPGKGAYSH